MVIKKKVDASDYAFEKSKSIVDIDTLKYFAIF